MDDFTVFAQSPQEDEFALLALGGQSVYRGFFDPRRLMQLEPLLMDDAGRGLGTPEAEAAWLGFLGRVRSLAPLGSDRLLLKSPNHSYRLATMMRLFPDCQAVWICRNPESILESNRRLWITLCGLYGLAPLDGDVLETWLTRVLEATADSLVGWSSVLPKNRFVVVSLDQLRREPTVVSEGIRERLGLSESRLFSSKIKDVAILRSKVRSAKERGFEGLFKPNFKDTKRIAALDRLALVQSEVIASHGLTNLKDS